MQRSQWDQHACWKASTRPWNGRPVPSCQQTKLTLKTGTGAQPTGMSDLSHSSGPYVPLRCIEFRLSCKRGTTTPGAVLAPTRKQLHSQIS